MTRWFRVYNELVDDPKVQRLEPPLFKALVNLWCLASANDGVLPPVDEIAFKLRMRPEKVQRVLTELLAAALLDDDATGTHPHNWAGRQFTSDGSTPRVKRFRERRRNVSPSVSETTPDTETEAERKSPSQGSTNSTDEALALAKRQRAAA